MEFSAQTIAEFLKGEVEGDQNTSVKDVSKIEEGKPGTLCFLANPKYEKYLYTTQASIVIVNKDLVLTDKVKSTLIRVTDAYQAFASLLELYDSFKPKKVGIEAPSFVSPSAKIGNDIYIGAFAYVGENATLGDNVKVYPQSYIGDNV
ncbi:MAG TPA: LpxD N-terminal domain-containing protein, partial [Bacteroidales bacterium]|nr:LpxD N-terminal domain-containing protein [Bacteroidales bacterium]